MPGIEKGPEGGYRLKPGAILERVKELATQPVESFKEHPVNTAADVMSVVFPAAKAAAGTKAGKAVIGAAGDAVDAVLDPVAAAAGKGTQKAMSAVFGPSEKAIRERLERNAAIVNAKTFPELAEDLAKSAEDISTQITKLDKHAWESLSKSHDPTKGAIPKTDIYKLIRDVRKEIQITGGGAIGPAQKNAIRAIDEIIKDLEKVGAKVPGRVRSAMGVPSDVKRSDFLSQAQVKEVLQSIRKNVKFNDDTAEITNRAIENVSESLDDLLKSKNQEYAARMEPVAERTRALKETQRLFNIKKETGGGFVPTDTTASKVKTSVDVNKAVTQKKLEDVKRFTGRDFLQEAEDFSLNQQFSGGAPNGARRVAGLGAIGGAAGGYMAGPEGWKLGAGLGAAAGLVIDKVGGRMAASMIDWYVRNQPLALGKYAPIMLRAAEKGPQAVTATHLILEQRDPEYQGLVAALAAR
ncbi:MAG: hypothetical protein HY548_08090 [Elusimicrobia bacterium]|nr:hypothetical protein [Elusimicrobiota bacterium]